MQFVSLWIASRHLLVVRLYDRRSNIISTVYVSEGSALWEAMS